MQKLHFQKLLKKEMTRKEFLAFSGFAIATVFGVVGLLKELASRAATPTANTEPENGTVTSPAAVVTDATASGGKAVKFGSSNPSYPYGAYGTYKPNATTTGVRAGTTLIPYTNQFGAINSTTGFLTLSTAGVTLSGFNIPAYIKITAADVTIENCLVRGPATIPSGTSLNLIAPQGTNTTIRDCTLVPDVPDHSVQGIQGRSFTAERNHIYNTVDGIDPTSNGATILANYIHDLAWFSPDSYHSDGHSHNDCIQFEGGPATVQYNNLEAFLSKTVGQGPTRPYDQANSALIATVTTPAISGLVISNNWIDGGQVSINIGPAVSGVNFTNLGTISGNTFGDNQAQTPKAINLNTPRATIGLTITPDNVFNAVDRPLLNAARAGTIVATGNGIVGG